MAKSSKKTPKKVETLTHEGASRKNIPTAEYQSVMDKDDRSPISVAYERRNEGLDPQLVWRGKDMENWSDLVVNAPPLYIQEKVHPKVLVDDLVRRSKNPDADEHEQFDLFADFNGVPDEASRTEFYEHDANWTNRMILGDSLQVMASLADREGLRGKVQCIYFDPPYGIKFNSNFQWSTTSRDVKDGKTDHITREPEQVKAFRDTWRDGIHSYLTYLRDRLMVARDLLTDSGSIFVQIGDENVHRVRALLDEVFGSENFISQIAFKKTSYQATDYLPNLFDYILWYSVDRDKAKIRQLARLRDDFGSFDLIADNGGYRAAAEAEKSEKRSELLRAENFTGAGASGGGEPVVLNGEEFQLKPGKHWKTHDAGIRRLKYADRLLARGKTICSRKMAADNSAVAYSNVWTDTIQSTFSSENVYVVQTYSRVIARCVLMATDPGDLVLDPTCGSGTTATVAEQWGRRWITVDTSRVALALTRARIMGARYPFYLLADSTDGQKKEAELTQTEVSSQPVSDNIRSGFVYERVPHITLKSIANNVEIDVIWETWQESLEPLREKLNAATKESWEECEIPREADDEWSGDAKKLHEEWWAARIARQQEIDASIAAKADFEYLYDKPYEDKKVVRVAGPFTVESISPHRILGVDENEGLIDPLETAVDASDGQDFATMVLENLKTSGVQQAHKEDKLNFASVAPWPGMMIGGEGRYREGDKETAPEKRAAIFIGPEFGTVSRADLVEAAKEAGEAGFDVLVSCAFNYEAHASEFDKLGKIPVLKARMNADLHMADDLKNTGKGNLFVIFGEPDIELLEAEGEDAEPGQIQVKVNGVDVFDPSSGEVRSDDADGIACWFVDTDYNEESFFVRQAYFLGANDPYKALKTTLKAEIDEEAWSSLNSDISRPFDKPKDGRIAVKVINHLGDEVMKVLRVD
jgi:adenine-specific DNA-methyltransferase